MKFGGTCRRQSSETLLSFYTACHVPKYTVLHIYRQNYPLFPVNCSGYVRSFEWNERLPGAIEILWLEDEKFKDYLKLISHYSSREIVEKHGTCTCVAVEIKIKIVGEEESRPIQQAQTFADDGGKKKINLSMDLRISGPGFMAVTAEICQMRYRWVNLPAIYGLKFDFDYNICCTLLLAHVWVDAK